MMHLNNIDYAPVKGKETIHYCGISPTCIKMKKQSEEEWIYLGNLMWFPILGKGIYWQLDVVLVNIYI